MKTVTIDDLKWLAIGCAILGSGGGGDPANEVLIAKHAINRYGPVTMLELQDLSEEDLILPVAIIGAPLVALEKLRSGREFASIVDLIEKRGGRRPTVLMPIEIGGANGFAALAIAGQLCLPVLNADLMGRAFPQLEMTSCTALGTSPSPVFLGDSSGNTVFIEGKEAKDLERIARHVAVSMGSSCAIAFRPMSAAEIKRIAIPSTTTLALQIGQIVSEAESDPIGALLEQTGGDCLGEGTIVSIEQSIQNGFLHGNVLLSGEEGEFELLYQNEYLLAKKEGLVVACTPDILMLIEKESGTPITADSLRYGLKVALVALPAPEIWRTEKGLALVGPERFGYSNQERTK